MHAVSIIMDSKLLSEEDRGNLVSVPFISTNKEGNSSSVILKSVHPSSLFRGLFRDFYPSKQFQLHVINSRLRKVLFEASEEQPTIYSLNSIIEDGTTLKKCQKQLHIEAMKLSSSFEKLGISYNAAFRIVDCCKKLSDQLELRKAIPDDVIFNPLKNFRESINTSDGIEKVIDGALLLPEKRKRHHVKIISDYLLKQKPFSFFKLPQQDNDLYEVASEAKLVKVTDLNGQILLKPGEYRDRLYVVLEGYLTEFALKKPFLLKDITINADKDDNKKYKSLKDITCNGFIHHKLTKISDFKKVTGPQETCWGLEWIEFCAKHINKAESGEKNLLNRRYKAEDNTCERFLNLSEHGCDFQAELDINENYLHASVGSIMLEISGIGLKVLLRALLESYALSALKVLQENTPITKELIGVNLFSSLFRHCRVRTLKPSEVLSTEGSHAIRDENGREIFCFVLEGSAEIQITKNSPVITNAQTALKMYSHPSDSYPPVINSDSIAATCELFVSRLLSILPSLPKTFFSSSPEWAISKSLNVERIANPSLAAQRTHQILEDKKARIELSHSSFRSHSSRRFLNDTDDSLSKARTVEELLESQVGQVGDEAIFSPSNALRLLLKVNPDIKEDQHDEWLDSEIERDGVDSDVNSTTMATSIIADARRRKRNTKRKKQKAKKIFLWSSASTAGCDEVAEAKTSIIHKLFDDKLNIGRNLDGDASTWLLTALDQKVDTNYGFAEKDDLDADFKIGMKNIIDTKLRHLNENQVNMSILLDKNKNKNSKKQMKPDNQINEQDEALQSEEIGQFLKKISKLKLEQNPKSQTLSISRGDRPLSLLSPSRLTVKVPARHSRRADIDAIRCRFDAAMNRLIKDQQQTLNSSSNPSSHVHGEFVYDSHLHNNFNFKSPQVRSHEAGGPFGAPEMSGGARNVLYFEENVPLPIPTLTSRIHCSSFGQGSLFGAWSLLGQSSDCDIVAGPQGLQILELDMAALLNEGSYLSKSLLFSKLIAKHLMQHVLIWSSVASFIAGGVSSIAAREEAWKERVRKDADKLHMLEKKILAKERNVICFHRNSFGARSKPPPDLNKLSFGGGLLGFDSEFTMILRGMTPQEIELRLIALGQKSSIEENGFNKSQNKAKNDDSTSGVNFPNDKDNASTSNVNRSFSGVISKTVVVRDENGNQRVVVIRTNEIRVGGKRRNASDRSHIITTSSDAKLKLQKYRARLKARQIALRNTSDASSSVSFASSKQKSQLVNSAFSKTFLLGKKDTSAFSSIKGSFRLTYKAPSGVIQPVLEPFPLQLNKASMTRVPSKLDNVLQKSSNFLCVHNKNHSKSRKFKDTNRTGPISIMNLRVDPISDSDLKPSNNSNSCVYNNETVEKIVRLRTFAKTATVMKSNAFIPSNILPPSKTRHQLGMINRAGYRHSPLVPTRKMSVATRVLGLRKGKIDNTEELLLGAMKSLNSSSSMLNVSQSNGLNGLLRQRSRNHSLNSTLNFSSKLLLNSINTKENDESSFSPDCIDSSFTNPMTSYQNNFNLGDSPKMIRKVIHCPSKRDAVVVDDFASKKNHNPLLSPDNSSPNVKASLSVSFQNNPIYNDGFQTLYQNSISPPISLNSPSPKVKPNLQPHSYSDSPTLMNGVNFQVDPILSPSNYISKRSSLNKSFSSESYCEPESELKKSFSSLHMLDLTDCDSEGTQRQIEFCNPSTEQSSNLPSRLQRVLTSDQRSLHGVLTPPRIHGVPSEAIFKSPGCIERSEYIAKQLKPRSYSGTKIIASGEINLNSNNQSNSIENALKNLVGISSDDSHPYSPSRIRSSAIEKSEYDSRASLKNQKKPNKLLDLEHCLPSKSIEGNSTKSQLNQGAKIQTLSTRPPSNCSLRPTTVDHLRTESSRPNTSLNSAAVLSRRSTAIGSRGGNRKLLSKQGFIPDDNEAKHQKNRCFLVNSLWRPHSPVTNPDLVVNPLSTLEVSNVISTVCPKKELEGLSLNNGCVNGTATSSKGVIFKKRLDRLTEKTKEHITSKNPVITVMTADVRNKNNVVQSAVESSNSSNIDGILSQKEWRNLFTPSSVVNSSRQRMKKTTSRNQLNTLQVQNNIFQPNKILNISDKSAMIKHNQLKRSVSYNSASVNSELTSSYQEAILSQKRQISPSPSTIGLIIDDDEARTALAAEAILKTLGGNILSEQVKWY